LYLQEELFPWLFFRSNGKLTNCGNKFFRSDVGIDMGRNLLTILVLVAVSVGGVLVCGCASDAQTGAGIGALIGAGIGQAVGGDTEATLIGAGVGAGAGYMIGNESDKQKAKTTE
jgi:hypothetical protein